MKKLFFKVYENKEQMKVYFVERAENIQELAINSIDNDELPSIFEPIMLTEEEFKKLKKFNGF